jgi:hypothetical protein
MHYTAAAATVLPLDISSMLLSESNHHCLYFVSQIILEKYPKTKDWPCDIVPWEKMKDLPEKDRHLLFLALAKMDNCETSESLVKATKWERYTFCVKNIFENHEFT